MKFSKEDSTTKQRLQNKAYDIEKALLGSLSLFPNKETLEAIKTSPAAYVMAMVNHKTDGRVNTMGLSELKLAGLYDIDVTGATTLLDYVAGSEFKDAISYTDKGLELDGKKTSQIIKENSTITLTKPQNDFLKQLEKTEAEYVKLFKYTQSPDSLFQVNQREKQFHPNVALIKHLIR